MTTAKNKPKTVWNVSNCPQLTQCEQKWEALREVAESQKIRFCDQCQQAVYRCETPEELDQHRALGHCIAIEVELPDLTSNLYLGGIITEYSPGSKLDWD